MIRPLALPPVDAAARLGASAIGQALCDPDRVQQAALAWARALECAVEIQALSVADTPPPAGPTAGLCWPDGRLGAVRIDPALLAGRLAQITGGAARSIGPVPLSPAEEGLFAWLVMAWCAVLPDVPALDWVDGGAALSQPIALAPAIRWRVVVDGAVGWARWQVPPHPASTGRLRGDLPLQLHLSAGRTHLRRRPKPGDLVVLNDPPALWLGDRRWPIRWRDATWHLISHTESRMPEPLDNLPLVVDARVGRLTLSVAEVSALMPGAVLPLAPDTTPIVTLTVGDRPIARGVLVDDGGRAAVQITQLIEAR